MERKTLFALIVILCVIIAAVVLVVVFYGDGLTQKNYAKDYILNELEGEIVECTIDEEVHFCHLIYRDDSRRIGEIWIYYYPGGIEKYKAYTFSGDATKAITSDNVMIFIGGTGDFMSDACDLYNQKFGFNCTPIERPER